MCKNIALPKNQFANHILKSEAPFDKICFDNFKLIFDIIRKIQNCPKKGEIVEKNCVNEVEISNGVYIKTFNNDLETLEIYGEKTEQITNIIKSGFLSIEPRIEKKTNTFSIILGNNSIHRWNISIPLNIELLQFLEKKIDNQYNRIELHLVNKEKLDEIVFELLKDDIAGKCIERELFKLYAES